VDPKLFATRNQKRNWFVQPNIHSQHVSIFRQHSPPPPLHFYWVHHRRATMSKSKSKAKSNSNSFENSFAALATLRDAPSSPQPSNNNSKKTEFKKKEESVKQQQGQQQEHHQQKQQACSFSLHCMFNPLRPVGHRPRRTELQHKAPSKGVEKHSLQRGPRGLLRRLRVNPIPTVVPTRGQASVMFFFAL
jgi:hypothetical protein